MAKNHQPESETDEATRAKEEQIAREEAQIDHFNDLVPVGRSNWLALLAYLTFIFVTVLAVQDIDFFLPQRSTALPLVNVTIPTRSFFIFAPILGAALYIYLHFNIRQVVEVFRKLPDSHKGERLETFLKPWILVDHLHRVRHQGAPRRMDALAGATTILMVWLAGPLVLGFFWYRSWPAHDEWITSVIGLSLVGCVYAGLSTWMLFRKVKGQRGDLINVGVMSVVVATLVIVVGFVRTDWGGSMRIEHGAIKVESLLARTNLEEALLTTQEPGTWINRDAFTRELAQSACDRAGIPKAICGADIEESDDPRASILLAGAYVWCEEEFGLSPQDCDVMRDQVHFDVLDEWSRRKSELFSSTPVLDLSGVDLRDANLRGATIRNVDFSGADLSGADFSNAVLESVDFSNANLSNAVFQRAQLTEAQFRNTDVSGTQFTDARMRAVVFFGSPDTPSKGTSFASSNIRGAFFLFADFQKISFSDTDIGSAFLFESGFRDSIMSDARLKNSIVLGVDFEGTDWAGAWLRRSLIGDVTIGEAEIARDQLDDMVAFDDDRWMAADAARPGPKRVGKSVTIEVSAGAGPDSETDVETVETPQVIVETSEGLLEQRYDLPTCWTRVPQEIKSMMWWYTRTTISHPEDYGPSIASMTCD